MWIHGRSRNRPAKERPFRFELSDQSRQAVDDYLKTDGKRPGEFSFTGDRGPDRSITTRQYARLVSEWIGSIGLDPRLFVIHSLRRTKAIGAPAISGLSNSCSGIRWKQNQGCIRSKRKELTPAHFTGLYALNYPRF
jgi:integrase